MNDSLIDKASASEGPFDHNRRWRSLMSCKLPMPWRSVRRRRDGKALFSLSSSPFHRRKYIILEFCQLFLCRVDTVQISLIASQRRSLTHSLFQPHPLSPPPTLDFAIDGGLVSLVHSCSSPFHPSSRSRLFPSPFVTPSIGHWTGLIFL